MQTGCLPDQLLQLYIAPLGKPKKNQQECSSKPPISLINSAAKILESLALTRMMQTVEEIWGGEQLAYRAARGTELRLAEVYTRITGSLGRDQFAFLANLEKKKCV